MECIIINVLDDRCHSRKPHCTLCPPMPSTSSHDSILAILTERVLPWWEMFGARHLMVSAATLEEFTASPLPADIRVEVRQRRGRKQRAYGPRPYNNTSYRSELWPEDGQEVIRYPALVCVLRGEAAFPIGDYVVHCREGHFMLFSPQVPQPDGNHPHLEHMHREGQSCELLWLMSSPAATAQMLAWTCLSQDREHILHPRFDLPPAECPEMVHFFDFFIREALDQPRENNALINACFSAFLHLLIRQLQTAPLPAPEVSPAKTTPIKNACAYIDSHLHLRLTTQNVAARVFMSRTNFIRHFQQETGQTFNQYLIKMRLQHAARLLREETLSIQMISQRVGLSPAQLRSLFHQHYGKSPAAYRAEQGQ